jgi:hypothetical protein
MPRKLLLGLFASAILSAGCKTDYNLEGSKWQTVKFVIDSSNYLTENDKNVYSGFDTTTKLYVKFSDSLMYAYVDGSPIDTSAYKIVSDTLFTIHKGIYRDTSLILNLSKDSLIEQRLAGVKTYSVRVKN